MKFSTILADPAWGFKNYSAKGEAKNPNQHYPCMTVDEICALPVGLLAADDCALFLWTTGPFLMAAEKVAQAWSSGPRKRDQFTYSTTAFTWAKQNPSGIGWAFGTGYWTRANPEFCLLFTKGSPKRLATDVPELLVAPRGRHSEKPVETFSRIERLTGGPFLELFSRATRPGWTCLGNEVTGNGLAVDLRALADQPSLFAEVTL